MQLYETDIRGPRRAWDGEEYAILFDRAHNRYYAIERLGWLVPGEPLQITGPTQQSVREQMKVAYPNARES